MFGSGGWFQTTSPTSQLVSLSLWVCFPRPMSFASGPVPRMRVRLTHWKWTRYCKGEAKVYMIHIIRFSNTHQHILDNHAFSTILYLHAQAHRITRIPYTALIGSICGQSSWSPRIAGPQCAALQPSQNYNLPKPDSPKSWDIYTIIYTINIYDLHQHC